MEKKVNIKNLLILFIFSRIFMIFIGCVYIALTKNNVIITDLFCKWDSGWYKDIIENGYMLEPMGHPSGDAANWAFFPLYPMICRVFYLITHIDANSIGLIISNICFFVAVVYSCKYIIFTRKDMDYNIVAILMLFGPWTFYFNSVYTESLFVMLIVMHFYYAKKEKFLAAGCIAALASATRLAGCFLVFFLLWNIYNKYKNNKDKYSLINFIIEILKKPKDCLALLICPLGTFSYMLYLYCFIGDAWAFKHIEKAWGRSYTGIEILKEWIIEISNVFIRKDVIGILLVLVCFYVYYLYFKLLKEKRYDEFIFGFLSITLPFLSSYYSMPRYIIGSFFIFPLITQQIEKFDKYKMIIINVLITSEILLLYCWMNGADFLI